MVNYGTEQFITMIPYSCLSHLCIYRILFFMSKKLDDFDANEMLTN